MRRLHERCARIVPKRVRSLITRIRPKGPLGRVVAARSTQDFGARLRVHRLCAAFLDQYQGSARSVGNDLAAPPRMWVYWAQGAAQMPPLVAACVRRLHAMKGDLEVVLLDDRNLDSHVEIPGYVYDRTFENKTHFSDILRVALLSRYGGVWIDATCYAQSPIRRIFDEVMTSGFFAYARNNDPYMLSSWFIAAEPGHLIPTVLYEALLFHWRVRTRLQNYFLIHYLFEALYELDADCRRQWDDTHKLNAYDPHVLQGKLGASFDAEQWERIITACHIHKLTYKLESEVPIPGSYLAHLLRQP